MKKCRISVLKRTFDKELAKEYGVENLPLCPLLNDGEVFYADFACPEGFCNEAWKAIYQYVFAFAHGMGENGQLFYNGDWIRKPGVAICACNDGIRPVIFKLERTDQQS
ncbi:MAG: TIGR04076 family protein [Deltaproteobacteria bacterium]|nr:TIGR04076 family protein [Deltaproteobacteria bacterium]